jgi:hypothetical protein
VSTPAEHAELFKSPWVADPGLLEQSMREARVNDRSATAARSPPLRRDRPSTPSWPACRCLSSEGLPQDQTGLVKNRQVSFQRPRPNLEPLAQLAGTQTAGAGQLVQNGLPAASDVAAAKVRYPAIYPAIYTATLAG